MPNRRRITPEERRTVYSLTGGKCAYCGKPLPFLDMQVDHVVPLHQGGADEAFNMLPSCRRCFVPVLVCRKNRQGGQIVEAGQKDVGGWWRVYGTRTKSVTHWMPMPDPPEDSGGQSGEKGRHSP